MGAIASHLWQSTVVAIVAAALAWLCRHNRASVRYWIWFAASMKFLIPFAAVRAFARELPWPDAALPGSDALAAVNRAFSVSAAPAISPTAYSTLALVWLVGTIVVAARWLREWNRMATIAREAEPATDGPVLDTLRRLEHATEIRTPLTAVCSRRNVEPGIVGIRNPVLVWPRHLSAGLRPEHIEPIVAHELAHVMRRDNLLASFHMMVGFAFWFHPVVWWIGRRLIEERERACDEYVLGLGQSASSYAAGILKTCELCIASPIVNVTGVTGGHLKKRIERIVDERVGAPLNFAERAAVATVAAVVFAAPIGAGGWAQSQNGRDVPLPEPSREMPTLSRDLQPEYSVRAVSNIEDEVRMDCVVKTDEKPSDFRMECVVRTDGEPSDIRIVQSRDLDQAPIGAARQSALGPATRRNKPVPVMMTVGIAFTLK